MLYVSGRTHEPDEVSPRATDGGKTGRFLARSSILRKNQKPVEEFRRIRKKRGIAPSRTGNGLIQGTKGPKVALKDRAERN